MVSISSLLTLVAMDPLKTSIPHLYAAATSKWFPYCHKWLDGICDTITSVFSLMIKDFYRWCKCYQILNGIQLYVRRYNHVRLVIYRIWNDIENAFILYSELLHSVMHWCYMVLCCDFYQTYFRETLNTYINQVIDMAVFDMTWQISIHLDNGRICIDHCL